jgi:hypothetical protein
MKEVIKHEIEKIKSMRLKNAYQKKINRMLKRNRHLDFDLDRNCVERIKHFWREKNGIRIRQDWHKAYTSVNGIFDERYVPEDIFYSLIEPKLNLMQFQMAYADKNIYTKLFTNILEPNIILRNINSHYYSKEYKRLSDDDVQKILRNYDGDIVIKPSIDSGGGKNVQILRCSSEGIFNDTKKVEFELIEKEYGGRDFIIQEKLQQHCTLSNIYPFSLNTMRIMSLRWKGEIIILSAVTRFGNKGSNVDNQALGGISCGIDKNGKFNNYGIDKYGSKYTEHPYSKYKFSEGSITHMPVILDYVKELHNQMQYFDLISWDIALNVDANPVLIELNLCSQEINFHQFNNGPLFGELTEEVCSFTL